MPDIKGYRDLSRDELALVNYIKNLEEYLGQSFQTLHSKLSTELPNPDWRWVAIYPQSCLIRTGAGLQLLKHTFKKALWLWLDL